MLRGETQYNPVSRFVREVPGELLDNKPQIFKKKTDFEEYRETPESRARFQTAPYGGNYAGAPSQAADWRPKAVVKPKRTDPENKPFIAQGIGSLAGVAGLSKGAGTKQASWNTVLVTGCAILNMEKEPCSTLWTDRGLSGHRSF